MKDFRRFTISWGVILILIFIVFTAYSFKLDKKIDEYRTLENNFASKVAEYNDANKIYPSSIEVMTVTASDAVEKGIIADLQISNDVCDGYVSISNDDIVVYTPYISCKHYTTKGYDKSKN